MPAARHIALRNQQTLSPELLFPDDPEEGKRMAYLDRSAARDAWDLSHLASRAHEVMTSKRFRSWFIALSAILNHPLTTYAQERIEKRITDRIVAEQLTPMLIGQAAPLRSSDLVERSWDVVCPVMKLGENEAKYITSIQQGELHPELLFTDDPEEGKRMALHPAILWKLVNVRAHLERGKTKPKSRPSERNHT